MNESIDSSCGNLPRERHQRDHKAESTVTDLITHHRCDEKPEVMQESSRTRTLLS
jgi:hypothetical protein